MEHEEAESVWLTGWRLYRGRKAVENLCSMWGKSSSDEMILNKEIKGCSYTNKGWIHSQRYTDENFGIVLLYKPVWINLTILTDTAT